MKGMNGEGMDKDMESMIERDELSNVDTIISMMSEIVGNKENNVEEKMSIRKM